MQRSFVISRDASPPPDPDKRGRAAATPPVVETSHQDSNIKSRRNRREPQACASREKIHAMAKAILLPVNKTG
jgi:hypothetical protein